MCSIMGYCGTEVDMETFEEGFERTESRGPDDSRIVDTGGGILAFHRLSIMGLTPEGMQPFELDGSYLVCNGEIYGFEKIKEELSGKYSFASDSDCEILLPMYREYGTDMFDMLDAEFVCIIYDGETGGFIAARDPVGIRPLYYGYDKKGVIVFASEPKNLTNLVDEIIPFPPGHYYKDGEFICYRDITAVEEVCDKDIDEVCAAIRTKLIAAVEKRMVSDSHVGYLLSGGLDSSLVCAIAARKSVTPIRTFAIGMSEDAIDLKYAKQVADYIGSEHTEYYMTPDDVISSLEDVIHALGTYDITTIRASMGMYLVCKAIHENTDIRVLLTGEISDELFGYKYTDFAPSAVAFQQEAIKRISEIHMYDVLRADRCISVNSLEARVPFGDLDFVKYVMSVDPELKINKYGKGKYLLRHAFEGLGYLPDGILWREKAAFSDAVGHSMVDYLKAVAEEKYTDEEFEDLRLQYDHARPFTKESLMYREIFEKYYPGRSGMVKDFWMPNREWEGCDVDDPSARALSNYGDSGK
jgi:asparagine synthase (glutamine-hydrolysing)